MRIILKSHIVRVLLGCILYKLWIILHLRQLFSVQLGLFVFLLGIRANQVCPWVVGLAPHLVSASFWLWEWGGGGSVTRAILSGVRLHLSLFSYSLILHKCIHENLLLSHFSLIQTCQAFFKYTLLSGIFQVHTHTLSLL